MAFSKRLRSAYYGFWLGVGERLGRARGPRPERPGGTLDALDLEAGSRDAIEALARAYGVRFEAELSAATALENYARLDLLDRAGRALDHPLPRGRIVHDVGCASFWYAAALHAAAAPAALTGFELEGYRRLRGGINRAERALGHVAQLPRTSWEIADYATIRRPAGLVTAFFPFVTENPVLAWRLPLAVLDPKRIFARIRDNLEGEGEFWMVNHGEREAELAARLAAEVGFAARGRYRWEGPLAARPEPAVVSRWTPVAPSV